ncbi:MAG TPA: uroporphyrinogen-III synthase [Stellaceae bacterium]|jgi:uroporphyrinogen-III synthase|nr:uroporphyrinogen-III synthase [Stellaceae bacterium]
MSKPLTGRRIVLSEHRELDRLARMLEGEGAETVRCPLVAIVDVADPAPVLAWIERLIARPCDDLIFLTGEGVRRLHALARRNGVGDGFVAALAAGRKLIRGPKPGAALRELGLREDVRAAAPTTDGVIATLSAGDLRGRRVGVQLYPDNPNDKLTEFLRAAGAGIDTVVPYAYASDADDRRVLALIDDIEGGRVDAIAFTSSPQITRLFGVAKAAGCEAGLVAGLGRIAVAAIGPVTAAALATRGVPAGIVPSGRYFMKPLVTAIVAALGRG